MAFGIKNQFILFCSQAIFIHSRISNIPTIWGDAQGAISCPCLIPTHCSPYKLSSANCIAGVASRAQHFSGMNQLPLW